MYKVLFVVFCTVSRHFALAQEDDECKEDEKTMTAAFMKNIESGDFPCFAEFELERFLSSEDGGDEEEKMSEFEAMIESADEDTRQKIIECSLDITEKTVEDCKGQVEEKCIDMMNEKLKQQFR